MLLLSQFPIKTLKSVPQGSDNKSSGYLLQGGYIRQELAGAYIYLPLGLKVLRKIEEIVRQEMNAAGSSEIYMTALGSKAHWQQTGRWDSVDVLFKVPGPGSTEYALNSTHEEVVVPLMQEFISSYKDLPLSVYQFQTKFRNEARAKSGLLRGREFLMKDMYSFHADDEDFNEYYEKMKEVYLRTFDRLGLGKDTYICLADGGDFTDKYSHEFQTILDVGEDEIYICEKCKLAFNKEVIPQQGQFACTECGNTNLRQENACEVGNIFPLETKFSAPFKVQFNTEDGQLNIPKMGCYGIGVSRLMGVIAEYFMDDKGLVWPESIAPYSHYIIVMGDNLDKALKLAKKIESEGGEVILDDREGKVGFGQKAGDADLLGIPYRVVVSDKTIEAGGYELKKRGSNEVEIIKM